MHNIIIDKPYRSVPPYKGTLWADLLQPFLPIYLRRNYCIQSVEFRGLDYLQTSLSAGHGILLAPNHCRPCDPGVMALISREVGRPFFYMASWHVFMQGNFQRWLFNRAGAFSVYREGLDREAIRTSTEILVEARRPLVLFPEGAISRTNDIVRPFMDGLSLIVHGAAKQRVKHDHPGSVVVHPVALKYLLLTDVGQSLHQVLGEIEARLSWGPQQLPLIDRIVKVGEALLALKELEYFGCAKNGEIHSRVQALLDHLLNRLEAKWLNGNRQASFMGRVKALRTAILKEMIAGDLPGNDVDARWKDLADIYLAVQLSCYPPYYLRSNPTIERLTETVERFEEDMTDKARTHGSWRVIIEIGEAIEVPPDQKQSQNGLSSHVQEKVQVMLDDLNSERRKVE